MKAIHQFVSGFSNGDAISNEALYWRRVFRGWGYASDIFCETRRILREHRRDVRDLSEARQALAPDDIALLHFSIGSPVNDLFAELTCEKALLYHNITPPEFFHRVNQRTVALLKEGRRQLRSLADTARVNLAVSRFNAEELRQAGYPDVRALPLTVGFDRLTVPPDPAVLRQFRDGSVNILFVGRGVPNKKIEDLIEAFDWFRHTVEPAARLIHVGSYAGAEPYYTLLARMARESAPTRIHFAGAICQPQLNAFYRCADLFLCMSEHEGFCIPLLESFHCDVPVLAYAAGAVPETLDGAGVLFREKDGPAVAEMMGELVRNRPLRDAVLDGQRARLARYRARKPEEDMRAALAPLLETELREASR